jgi:hypothetical protein
LRPPPKPFLAVPKSKRPSTGKTPSVSGVAATGATICSFELGAEGRAERLDTRKGPVRAVGGTVTIRL